MITRSDPNFIPGVVVLQVEIRFQNYPCPIRSIWQEEVPVLEVTTTDGTLIEADATINLGQFEYYQTVDLTYLIHNTSSTSSMEISDVSVENITNLGKVDSNPEEGFSVDPTVTRTWIYLSGLTILVRSRSIW